MLVLVVEFFELTPVFSLVVIMAQTYVKLTNTTVSPQKFYEHSDSNSRISYLEGGTLNDNRSDGIMCHSEIIIQLAGFNRMLKGRGAVGMPARANGGEGVSRPTYVYKLVSRPQA